MRYNLAITETTQHHCSVFCEVKAQCKPKLAKMLLEIIALMHFCSNQDFACKILANRLVITRSDYIFLSCISLMFPYIAYLYLLSYL